MCFATTVTTFSGSLESSRALVSPTTPALCTYAVSESIAFPLNRTSIPSPFLCFNAAHPFGNKTHPRTTIGCGMVATKKAQLIDRKNAKLPDARNEEIQKMLRSGSSLFSR